MIKWEEPALAMSLKILGAALAVIFLLVILDVLLLMRMRAVCPDAPVKEIAGQLPAVLVMAGRPPVIRVNSATARIWVKEGGRQ